MFEKCNCHSYNGDFGDRSEITLELPWPMTYPDGRPKTHVSVDACIADVVQAVWDAGTVTFGCCCGHGKRPPGLVVGDIGDWDALRRVLEADGRHWTVERWDLCLVMDTERV